MRLVEAALALAWPHRPAARDATARPARTAAPAAPLRALTLAALALPGVAFAVEAEEAQVQYGHYEESGRNYWGGPAGTVARPADLEVDSIEARLGLRLTDRVRLVFEYLEDTWSGATPILSGPEGFLTVSGASAYPATDSRTNQQLVPYGVGPNGTRVPQPKVWNVMTAASAETRRQGDLTLSREWDDFALSIGAGVSSEPDYTSYSVRGGGRWDFNRKLTTLNGAVSYTSSNIDANLGPAVDWIDYGQYTSATSGAKVTTATEHGIAVQKFTGDRQDWSANLGITQVLGRNSIGTLGLTYARSSGMLENPYKLVMLAFADPSTPPVLFNGLLLTRIFNVAESRPDHRNQWTVNGGYSHFFSGVDGALRLNLAYSTDDWGIQAQTVEAQWAQGLGDGWVVTPQLRYYSQSAADFYQPYFIWAMRAPVNGSGDLDFSGVPAQHYSSDYRLAAFGAASAGVNVNKQFARGLTLLAGVEYYVHASDLQLGGNGSGSFADFNAWTFNVGIHMDLASRPGQQASAYANSYADAGDAADPHAAHRADAGQGSHAGHGAHAGSLAPAGVMYAHMLDQPGAVMVGYRGMLALQAGDTLHGTDAAGDAAIAAKGCPGTQCTMKASDMSMQMHMLDLMYAPSERVNLMLMLQFMNMYMSMDPLAGTTTSGGGGHDHGGDNTHSTAGVGDTSVAAMLKLWDGPGQEIHAALALSMPTGSVNQKMSNGQFMDYGMQLGSGTWDLQPSLTYSGSQRSWFWGAQLSGIWRTGGDNASGYKLGNVLQATAWGGYQLTNWLSGSLRSVYTAQDEIDGQFNGPQMAMGPMDFPQNYGGHYWDVGVGLSFALPGGGRHGDRISLEWLQPVYQDVNGYQLRRTGAAWLSAGFVF